MSTGQIFSLRTPIEQMQAERLNIKIKLMEGSSYNSPEERTADAKRLREINKKLNEHYLKSRGI